MRKILLLFVLMVTISSLHAQVRSYEEFINALDRYNKNYLPEKIYVHTDKDAYLAGELMWYRIYYVDGFFNKPLDVSKVAYVELIDQSLESVYQAKVSLDPAESNGSIHLPLHLASGIYQFKVYTNYMKNFGEELFFEKQIAIYNTLSSDTLKTAPLLPALTSNIYPEGGELVYGLSSNVAFKIVNELGVGVDYTAYLVSNGRDTIRQARSHKFGMGNIEFTPQRNHEYHLVFVTNEGFRVVKKIEGIQDVGHTLHVNEQGNDLVAKLYTNITTNNFRSRLINLLVTSNRIPIAEVKSNFQNGEASFTIPLSELKDGINILTFVNDFGEPIAERLYFKHPSDQLKINSSVSASSVATRAPVTISLNGSNLSSTKASLSIYRVDSLMNIDQSDIYQYLWLSGELNGVVEDPAYYFSAPDADVKKSQDLLMLVNGWRRFDWQKIHQPQQIVYSPELVGQIIYGTVTDSRTNAPVKDALVYLSIPDYYYKEAVSQTDESGNFVFELKEIYGDKDIYIQVADTNDYYNIELRENFLEKHQLPFSRTFSYQTVKNIEALEEYHIGMQTMNFYYADRIRDYRVLKDIDTVPFFQKPNYSYILDNYVRFNTMEEVLREFVSPISVSIRRGKPTFSMVNIKARENFRDNLLAMVDGLPLVDNSLAFNIDPLKIERIEIIPRYYIQGPAHYNGIINFKSYDGNLADVEIPRTIKIFSYEGLQKYRQFHHPSYQTEEQKASRMPDFRHTMYWNPSIALTSGETVDIEIYTSDLKGKYIGVLQALDESGKAGSSSFSFEVK